MKPKKTDSPLDMPPETLVPCAALTPREGNRNLSTDSDLDELAESLAVVGQLNPIHVRVLEKGRYEIIAGVRRWQAAQLAGWTDLRAVIHESCDETKADQIRFVENAHRKDPTALDTARALQRIKNINACSHDEVAKQAAIPVGRVKLYLSIFAASDALLKAIETHALPISTSVELVRFEKTHGEVAVRPLLRRVAAGDLARRDIAALRKRKAGSASSASSAARDPWPSLEQRFERLHSSNPDETLSRLEALCARLRASRVSTMVAGDPE